MTEHEKKKMSLELKAQTDLLDNRFYKLKLDQSHIHLIDTCEKFTHFLDLMEQASMKQSGDSPLYVGVDSEWKPTCVSGVSGENTTKVALIQIATDTDVYLIDTVSIEFNSNLGKMFSSRFFTNKRIIKLGYGFSHDIRAILLSTGCLSESDAFRHTVLDLAHVVNQVRVIINIIVIVLTTIVML